MKTIMVYLAIDGVLNSERLLLERPRYGGGLYSTEDIDQETVVALSKVNSAVTFRIRLLPSWRLLETPMKSVRARLYDIGLTPEILGAVSGHAYDKEAAINNHILKEAELDIEIIPIVLDTDISKYVTSLRSRVIEVSRVTGLQKKHTKRLKEALLNPAKDPV